MLFTLAVAAARPALGLHLPAQRTASPSCLTQAPAEAAPASAAKPSPEEEASPEEVCAREDALLAKAEAVRAKRALLAKAYSQPGAEPRHNTDHQGYLVKELKWLAVDLAQVMQLVQGHETAGRSWYTMGGGHMHGVLSSWDLIWQPKCTRGPDG